MCVCVKEKGWGDRAGINVDGNFKLEFPCWGKSEGGGRGGGGGAVFRLELPCKHRNVMDSELAATGGNMLAQRSEFQTEDSSGVRIRNVGLKKCLYVWVCECSGVVVVKEEGGAQISAVHVLELAESGVERGWRGAGAHNYGYPWFRWIKF